MAADDITSQDAAVIGDDLVEALGFEPITADAGSGEEREGSTSEVAVLDDTSLDDRPLDDASSDQRALDDTSLDERSLDQTFVDSRDGDDIEIIDDATSDEFAVEEQIVDAPDAEIDSDVEVDTDLLSPDRSDTDTFDSNAPDAAGPEVLEADEVEAEAADTDLETASADTQPVEVETTPEATETSLFGSPTPAYVWGKRQTADETPVDDSDADNPQVLADALVDETALDETVLDDDAVVDEPATDELSTDELATDGESDDTGLLDEAVDEETSPVVFFNNSVDTDTAPLPDLDEEEAPDVEELVETDLEAGDLELDEVELDKPQAEIDLSDPAPPVSTSLIDLDRGDDLAVGDEIADEDTVAIPVQRPALDLPSGRDRGLDLDLEPEPTTETALETADSRVEPVLVPTKGHRKKLRARKSRRVVRHIDPWSVLTFSVLFHLCFFAALLLASVLVWNAALAAGTIENIENFVRELGDYETFEINSDQVFRAAALIAGLLTMASSVLVVLLTVVFNLISDLIGGIRVTVIEEETVRIPGKSEK